MLVFVSLSNKLNEKHLPSFTPHEFPLETVRGDVILAQSRSCQSVEIIVHIDQAIDTLRAGQSTLLDSFAVGHSQRFGQTDVQIMLEETRRGSPLSTARHSPCSGHLCRAD